MQNKKHQRLDARIAELYPQYNRSQIQSWIMQGYVTVEGKAVTKPGTPVKPDMCVNLAVPEKTFVSRAGFKLEHALTYFTIDVQNAVALDAGLSTGGFTECLLKHGARKVFGVDVGYGQVHEHIRHDPRVVVMERTNLRYLEPSVLGELVDIITLDLSFISLLKVMDAVTLLLKPNGQLVTLIKPQFEAGKEDVGRGGVIKDPLVHERVITTVIAGIEAHGFLSKGVTPSPICGADGNQEFLAYFIKKA